jgi:hypothetical protein
MQADRCASRFGKRVIKANDAFSQVGSKLTSLAAADADC